LPNYSSDKGPETRLENYVRSTTGTALYRDLKRIYDLRRRYDRSTALPHQFRRNKRTYRHTLEVCAFSSENSEYELGLLIARTFPDGLDVRIQLTLGIHDAVTLPAPESTY
jgi:hypothetical protein